MEDQKSNKQNEGDMTQNNLETEKKAQNEPLADNGSENGSKTNDNSEPLTKEQELELQNQDLTNTLQRLQAEFENFRKRLDKEKADFANFAAKGIIQDLLPILDNFTLAIASVKEENEFTKGVELIYAQLYGVLEKTGLKKIDTKGKMFDPQFHEVLMADNSDKPKDTILEEFQAGYMLGEKVLRPSKVKVSNGN